MKKKEGDTELVNRPVTALNLHAYKNYRWRMTLILSEWSTADCERGRDINVDCSARFA